MKPEEVTRIKRLIEFRLSTLMDTSDATLVAENILDEVVSDIEDCADTEWNISDVHTALSRVIIKRLNIEQ